MLGMRVERVWRFSIITVSLTVLQPLASDKWARPTSPVHGSTSSFLPFNRSDRAYLPNTMTAFLQVRLDRIILP